MASNYRKYPKERKGGSKEETEPVSPAVLLEAGGALANRQSVANTVQEIIEQAETEEDREPTKAHIFLEEASFPCNPPKASQPKGNQTTVRPRPTSRLKAKERLKLYPDWYEVACKVLELPDGPVFSDEAESWLQYIEEMIENKMTPAEFEAMGRDYAETVPVRYPRTLRAICKSERLDKIRGLKSPQQVNLFQAERRREEEYTNGRRYPNGATARRTPGPTAPTEESLAALAQVGKRYPEEELAAPDKVGKPQSGEEEIIAGEGTALSVRDVRTASLNESGTPANKQDCSVHEHQDTPEQAPEQGDRVDEEAPAESDVSLEELQTQWGEVRDELDALVQAEQALKRQFRLAEVGQGRPDRVLQDLKRNREDQKVCKADLWNLERRIASCRMQEKDRHDYGVKGGIQYATSRAQPQRMQARRGGKDASFYGTSDDLLPQAKRVE